MSEPVGLTLQIQCVRRELAQRRHVYPRLTASGRMTQRQADEEMRRMEAVLATLEQVRAEREPTLL